MKKLIENFIIIMVLTIAILFSYALIEKKISGRSSSESSSVRRKRLPVINLLLLLIKETAKKEIIHPRSRQIL